MREVQKGNQPMGGKIRVLEGAYLWGVWSVKENQNHKEKRKGAQ